MTALGNPAPRIDVVFRRRSDDVIVGVWTDEDGSPRTLLGAVSIELGDRTWPGSVGGPDSNEVTWTLTAQDTDVAWTTRPVTIARVNGQTREVLGRGTATAT
ncbi:hypothetical protein ACFFKU_06810 [Kineococcus gynurae]|uniref:Uncharacterized protein n=1 Tax=Kineococcus gynurae TaxID=452979 RepID=A0ABV5LWY7_9ACTN